MFAFNRPRTGVGISFAVVDLIQDSLKISPIPKDGFSDCTKKRQENGE